MRINRNTRRRVKIVRKKCVFCDTDTAVDYKETSALTRYLSERGKILSKKESGTCSKHQRRITQAIKRARYMAIMPYMVRPI